MALSMEASTMSVTRQKHDVAWKHCQMFKEGSRVHMKCLYCGKMFKGGGIHRFKEHLAGHKGGGPMCQRVPPEVRLLMQQSLEEVVGRQRKPKRMFQEESSNFSVPPIELDTMGNLFDDQEQKVQTTRQKRDSAWKYCETLKNEGRVQIKCKYCSKMFKGGGIFRFKEHLAGRKGSAPICGRVPPEVRILMEQNLNEVQSRQKKKQTSVKEEANNASSPASDMETFANHRGDLNADFEAAMPCNSGGLNSYSFECQEDEKINGNSNRRKRGRSKIPVTVDNADPSNALGSKVVDKPSHVAMGRFLYDVGANLDASDSIYLQSFIHAIASGGSGVTAPSYIDLRGCILKNLVEEVRKEVGQYRDIWERNGCSILVEEWNSQSGRTLLNFLVYCSQGTVFLRSVDATDIIFATDGLYGLLKEVVEDVGVANVLQVITKGEEHYYVAGKKLMDAFPSLYWAPCATFCIDLILEDFGKLEWINQVIEQAQSVTRFIYNNSVVLNLMRKFTIGNDIVQQGVTRSATNFTTLKRMADFKLNLQTMVTSQEWADCPYSKQRGGLAMLDVITNRSFWSSCILIIRLTNPLLQVLGIVSSEKRAAMGYVFSGIYLAKETIKTELVKREDYMVYWNIIHLRWEQQRLPPLHAAGFFLNPKFFYDIEGKMHNEILSRLFDSIERLVPDVEVQDKIVKELNLYKYANGDLGRKMAMRARETLLPAEWWSAYGGGCPNLARLAVRILNQTCSSIVYKQNHIPFEKIYNTRNCLERQRITDIVFVQYNLRLRQMVNANKNKISLDPISFDNIDIVEEWISQPELCLEDHESLDWMSLIPSANTTQLGPSTDETEPEDFATGFDDSEIFDGLKEVK